jgi:hypothetical protein
LNRFSRNGSRSSIAIAPIEGGSGVRRCQILRAKDDPDFVMIDLEFDTADETDVFLPPESRSPRRSDQRPGTVTLDKTAIYTSRFPDINVWVALTCEGHTHHSNAAEWFATLSPDAILAFCRFTQLGLLSLLTTVAVMSDEVMTQPQGMGCLRPMAQGSAGRTR